MSAIINKFSELVDRHKDTFHRDHVDISDVSQVCNISTPLVQLKLSSDMGSACLAEAIIRNLCKYAPQGKFPVFGLRAIRSIIIRDVAVEDTLMQQIMLLHSTKMNMNVDSLCRSMILYHRMTCDIRLDDNLENWILIAKQTIENKNVKNLINQSMIETFGSHIASRIYDTKDCTAEVVFFNSELHTIRGFSGFNAVYINRGHFDEKILKPKPNDLILLDIVTVVVHELAHLRIRQVFDDLNMSTPILLTLTDSSNQEFGRIVETKIFGTAVDWVFSHAEGAVPQTFINDFLKAIRFNEELPKVPADAVLYARTNPVTFYGGGGADVSYDSIFT